MLFPALCVTMANLSIHKARSSRENKTLYMPYLKLTGISQQQIAYFRIIISYNYVFL